MFSIFNLSGTLAVAVAYTVCSLLSGCNSPVVNSRPTQTRPTSGGPVLPELGKAYPEMSADDAVTTHQQSASYYHEVTPGETLGKIAKKYRVSVDELIRANGLNEPDRLQPGQLIYIPGRNAPATN